MLESLLERLEHGDRLALARLLSYAANGDHLREILTHLKPPRNPSRIVAITGSAGVGKSTLVGKLTGLLRDHDRRVAVLACDPQSPVTGGALLGDRFRIAGPVDDEGIFIRSEAAAPGHGALADHLEPMIRLLESFGFEIVFVETAGAGQADTAVSGLGDLVVLLLQPEAGDDLQWEKAGILEVADIVVINKADMPKADQVEGQVRSMLALSEGDEVPVVRVSAKTGEGLEKLWSIIEWMSSKKQNVRQDGSDLMDCAQQHLAGWFAQAKKEKRPALLELIKEWRYGNSRDEEVLAKLFKLFHTELVHPKATGGEST